MKQAKTSADLGISKKSRVLIFMPHPDDEAVFVSGLLQKLSQSNIPVKLITLTAGEKSTLRYTLSPTDNLAKARRKELKNAIKPLGVTDLEIWSFPDGGLEDSFQKMRVSISQTIKTFKPTHLITLEPDGIYGHPDHISLSQAVTQMCPISVKLIYATVTPRYILPHAKHMAKKAIIRPLKPDYKLNLSLAEVVNKIKALKAHRSQFQISPFHPKTIIHFLLNDMLFHEYYSYAK